MKNLLYLFSICMLCSCEPKTPKEEKSTQNSKEMIQEEKEKITSVLHQYKTSLNNADAVLATSLYHKDAVFLPQAAPAAIGPESILKTNEFIFSQIKLNLEFYIEEIVVDGDLAFVSSHSDGTATITANGDTVPEQNRELFVFEKIDSEWKILRYMFNKSE